MLCVSFKTSKLKPVLNTALSRLIILKNQRQIRFSQSRSDVVQLLQLGHHERALVRVEHVIVEQDMLDVYAMVESYCYLLLERVNLIENERVCPDELKEAVSGMLYGASRCGDFPELQKIRYLLTSRFGKEFAARAMELRNNCRVNHALITKLSTRQRSLESRKKILKEIATEKNIALHLEETSSISKEKEVLIPTRSPSPNLNGRRSVDNLYDKLSEDELTKKAYRDFTDAAMAAFESAAYAAVAARTAVERSSPRREETSYKHVSIFYDQLDEELKSSPLYYGKSSKSSITLSQVNNDKKDLVFDEIDDSDYETTDELQNHEQNDMPPSLAEILLNFKASLNVESVSQDFQSGIAETAERINKPKD